MRAIMLIDRLEIACRPCSVVLPQLLLHSGRLSWGSLRVSNYAGATGGCVRITTQKPSPPCIRKRGMSAQSKNARYTLLMTSRVSNVDQRSCIDIHLQIVIVVPCGKNPIRTDLSAGRPGVTAKELKTRFVSDGRNETSGRSCIPVVINIFRLA